MYLYTNSSADLFNILCNKENNIVLYIKKKIKLP